MLQQHAQGAQRAKTRKAWWWLPILLSPVFLIYFIWSKDEILTNIAIRKHQCIHWWNYVSAALRAHAHTHTHAHARTQASKHTHTHRRPNFFFPFFGGGGQYPLPWKHIRKLQSLQSRKEPPPSFPLISPEGAKWSGGLLGREHSSAVVSLIKGKRLLDQKYSENSATWKQPGPIIIH